MDDLVGLSRLMKESSGDPECIIGVVDGPACKNMHTRDITCLLPVQGNDCKTEGSHCIHASAVISVLHGGGDRHPSGICPKCRVLLYPLYKTASLSAAPEQLAEAIIALVKSGVTIINLSLAVINASESSSQCLSTAIDYACSEGVYVVAAAGNQHQIATTTITRHPWVIPVTASDEHGETMLSSNLGAGLARRGVRAPGTIRFAPHGGVPQNIAGTSIAAAYVSGILALLLSLYKGVEPIHFLRSLRSEKHHTCVPAALNVDNACLYLSQYH